MLLNFLHCTEHLPMEKNDLAQNVDSAEVEKPWPALNEAEVAELPWQSIEEKLRRRLEVEI